MALTVSVDEIVSGSSNPLLLGHPSWKRVRLGDVASIQNGGAFESSLFSKSEGAPLIRIRDIASATTETRYRGEFDPCYLVQPGDLLIGMDGDFNCARWQGEPGLLNQRVCRVRIHSADYEERFLDYVLPSFLKAINNATSSVTVKHLSSRTVADIPLPLPPKEQQREIAAELDRQFSRLDEAVAGLKRVKANLKRYKAAILKAAVEGRLVPTEADLARHECRNYETGAQLLQRILATRRSQWQGKSKYKEPSAPNTSDLPELPNGWAWTTLEQLSYLVTSGSRGWGNFYSVAGPLFIRAQDIKSDVLTLETVARVDVAATAEGTRSSVGASDILITITGANVTKSALVPPLSEQAFVSQHVALVKLALAETAPFIFDWVVSPGNGRKILEAWAYGAGKPGLSLEQVRSLPVALPPLPEQHRIVAEVDRLLSIAREAEAKVEANLKRARALRESVLGSTFSPV
jgi:type I restriction enzyme S subunit